MMQWPQPSDDFRWVQVGPGPALVCRGLEPFADHVFSTRAWAIGSGNADELAAWTQISSQMGISLARLVRVRQVHGADVLVRRIGDAHPGASSKAGVDDVADVIVSNDPGLALAIRIADCVPLLIADRRTGAVAAAHAGWRGLAAGVPAAAVGALAREFGSRPSDLVAAAGPSIGACCYEVGEDVRLRFKEAGFTAGQLARWFFPSPRPSNQNASLPSLPNPPRPGHWYFDGWEASRAQLEAAGVPAQQIFDASLCTASHADMLCSYRRDGSPAGRMVAVIKARSQKPEA